MGKYGETLSTFKICLDAHKANHIRYPSSKCGQSGMIPLSQLLQECNIILNGKINVNFISETKKYDLRYLYLYVVKSIINL